MNKRLLLLRTADETAATFDQMLVQVTREYPSDPYAALFCALARRTWNPTVHQFVNAVADGQSAELDSQAGLQSCGISPSSPSPVLSIDAVAESAMPWLTSLDAELDRVTNVVSSLQQLQVIDAMVATAALGRVDAILTKISAKVASLAAAANEAAPFWATRDEFLSIWQRLSELDVARNQQSQRDALVVRDIKRLLGGVTVQHRVPTTQAQFTQLARCAASEMELQNETFAAMLEARATDTRSWLKWAWDQSDQAAEDLQGRLQQISPALARLVSLANWADLIWPADATPEGHLKTAVPTCAGTEGRKPAGSPTVEHPRGKPPEVAIEAIQTTEPVPPRTSSLPKSTNPPADLPIAQQLGEFHAAKIQRQPREQPDTLPLPIEAAPPLVQPGVTAPVGVGSAALAEQLMLADQPPRADALKELAWILGGEDRWGLGSHLLRLAAGLTDQEAALVQPALFALAALGPRLSYEVSPLSECLIKQIAEFDQAILDALPATERHRASLLIAGALMRPALLAAQTGAGGILRNLSLPWLPAFGRLVTAVADLNLHGGALRADLLQKTLDETERQRRLAEVREELMEWRERAPNVTFNFAPAGKLWRFWLRPRGVLYTLVENALVGGANEAASLARDLDRWRTEPVACIQQGMKDIGQRDDLDGMARDKMEDHLGKLTGLLARWLALQQVQTGKDNGHLQSVVAKLSRHFQRDGKQAEQDLALQRQI